MNAWAKSGDVEAPKRARDVLDRMESFSTSTKWGKKGRGLDISPDATSFASVINAYARSPNFGKAQAAYELFLHMKELYDDSGKAALRPNSVVYNSVLNACAFTVGDLEEQSQSIRIANAMLVGLDESPYGKPDHITYGTYLKVVTNQMPIESEARNQIVEAVFRKCAKDGMVGELVLRQLKEMGGMEKTYEKLLGKSIKEELSPRDLPSSWTRNVIEGKRMRRLRVNR